MRKLLTAFCLVGLGLATFVVTSSTLQDPQELEAAIDDAIDVCTERFQAGELQPGDEIGACYAKATENRCDGSLDGSSSQVCLDWVERMARGRS